MGVWNFYSQVSQKGEIFLKFILKKAIPMSVTLLRAAFFLKNVLTFFFVYLVLYF